MTRLLHECIAHQRSLDDNLDSLLSRRTDLDKQLISLQKSSHVLSLVRSDSQTLHSSVNSTSLLAHSLSSKVRDLDLSQSRVSHTLLHLNAIVDKSHCLESLQSSLSQEDYESAAISVSSYLQIDSQFPDNSGSGESDQLLTFKRNLESIVKKKLAAAIDQRDHPTVLRFIRLYPMLGIEEEGLQIYVTYLKKVISMRSKMEYEQVVEMMKSGGTSVNVVGCLTSLFKDIVTAIEENDEILRSLCGEDGVVYAICELQEECDSRGTVILKKYMEYRKLGRLPGWLRKSIRIVRV